MPFLDLILIPAWENKSWVADEIGFVLRCIICGCAGRKEPLSCQNSSTLHILLSLRASSIPFSVSPCLAEVREFYHILVLKSIFSWSVVRIDYCTASAIPSSPLPAHQVMCYIEGADRSPSLTTSL